MPGRPPLPYRWEAHLAAGVLTLLLASALERPGAPEEPPASFDTPALRRWWEAGRAERSRPPWRRRFVLERNVVRGVTSLLLAWRCYHLEHLAGRR